MGFDNLKAQTPRTKENTRVPEAANAYGDRAIAISREAAETVRTVMDISFG